jgi:hypothetical protein
MATAKASTAEEMLAPIAKPTASKFHFGVSPFDLLLECSGGHLGKRHSFFDNKKPRLDGPAFLIQLP